MIVIPGVREDPLSLFSGWLHVVLSALRTDSKRGAHTFKSGMEWGSSYHTVHIIQRHTPPPSLSGVLSEGLCCATSFTVP